VLVTSEVVHEAAEAPGVEFREIGPVDLKGLTGAVELHAVHRSS
jgi:hypothetical protein